MKELQKDDLVIGERCLFQMSHWAPHNLHYVEILYAGKEHVLMHNIDRNSEYCVKYDFERAVIMKEEPKFYVSEERTE